MKIAAAFVMVCMCFLIVWNIPRPDFSDYKGFPVLGQTINGKFYPNPERQNELTQIGEMVLESSKEGKLSVVVNEEGYLDFIGKDFVLSIPYGVAE
jgi:hypothetical protein